MCEHHYLSIYNKGLFSVTTPICDTVNAPFFLVTMSSVSMEIFVFMRTV